MSNELTDRQKNILAHALLMYGALHGDSVTTEVVTLVTELNITRQYARLLLPFVEAADNKALKQHMPKDNDSKT